MRFTKMHGLGNDYIYVNCFEETVENPSEVAKKVSDRHFGIGSDGLVLIMPSERADFKMRMFNSDGSEAEMCGNAIRCVGKYVFDRGMTNKNVIRVETLAGIKVLELTVQDGKAKLVKVDMGEPILKPENIPVNSDKEIFRTEPVEIDGKEFKVTCVSMGNPHAVSYVKNVDIFPLEKIGPKMEHHPLFPKRINAEFVEVIDRTTLKMRVWERGTGETLACGTGACAVLVASVLNGVSERKATVKLLGGDLIIEWNENNNHVYMTGPAVKVFEGEVDLNEL
ncbi:diaminopimelate epimerase [Acetivibrio thermocellus]|uniref:diaminopimelate epimerase n=1 Tax=Acetivibrio thermocellus TaxID=1515 RepID=UPI0010A5FFBC|nr:diaminopimelate epimerase [Acetivibrio thermocellus]THJ76723.1 diaminopimelate epimerase [Acetivibrio thermocellus]